MAGSSTIHTYVTDEEKAAWTAWIESLGVSQNGLITAWCRFLIEQIELAPGNDVYEIERWVPDIKDFVKRARMVDSEGRRRSRTRNTLEG